MEIAILKTDGVPVKLDDSFNGYKGFDIDGFLFSFTFNNKTDFYHLLYQGKYRYYQNADFREDDLTKYRTGLVGYYPEEMYLRYNQPGNAEFVTIAELAKMRFNFEKFLAKAGETITVKKIDFEAPFDNYYQLKHYTFPIETTTDGLAVRRYKTSDNLVISSYTIPVPESAIINTIPVDRAGTPAWYFFQKNFGSRVNTWAIDDTEKVRLKKLAYIITQLTYRIVEEVLTSRVLYGEAYNRVQQAANRTHNDISDLSPLEQFVFTLMRNWGYFYKPDAAADLEHRKDFDAVLPATPDFQQYLDYYNGLSAFYRPIYRIQYNLVGLPHNEILEYILSEFPISILTLVPFSVIKSILQGYTKIRELKEVTQAYAIRLIYSITLENADAFLDFLLEQPDGITTNFELLYSRFSDARRERYVFVNWFVEEQTNRKFFAFAAYQLWKTSKYNPNYLPPNQVPVAGDINPEAYFIKNSQEFNPGSAFTFTTADSVEQQKIKHVEAGFQSAFNGRHLKIETKKETTVSDYSTPMAPVHYTLTDTPVYLGRYHLYHPIMLVGYKPNLDLALPQNTVIPAFLFHFAEEYDRLADFDAAMNLVLEITIDVAAFYFSGGVTILSDLRYLRHVTQLGRALRNAEGATEMVELWRGLEAGWETFGLTASVIGQIGTYLTTSENDPAKRKILERNQQIFLALTFLSVGGSLRARHKAMTEATEVLKLIKELPVGVSHGLSSEHIRLLEFLKGQQALGLLVMSEKIKAVLGTGANNLVLAFFNSLSDAHKLTFIRHFQYLKPEELAKLNGKNGSILQFWLQLTEKGIEEAKEINFLLKEGLVESIIRFYDNTAFKNLLDGLSYNQKVKFIQEFGEHLDDVTLELLKTKPKRMGLLEAFIKSKKQGPDAFNAADIIAIVKSDISEIGAEFLTIKAKIPLRVLNVLFRSEISNVRMTKDRLRALYEKDAFGEFMELVTGKFKKNFQGSNSLTANFEIFSEGISVEKNVEKYISGENIIKRIFNDRTLPEKVIDPDALGAFGIFNRKAIDGKGRDRLKDTEIKFIFNFLENHWHKGDKFIIEFESIISVCGSCQGYLMYLKQLAKDHDKIVEITIISDPSIQRTKHIKDQLR